MVRALEPGQTLKLIDTMGQQAIDFLCYSAELPLDRINIPTTVRLNKSLYITKGSKIYSDRARAMMSVLEDTCGYHDTLAGCCSCEIDKVRYGVDKTESCRTNFIAELAKWSMSPSEIVSNINFFMRVKFADDGELTISEGISKPGDYVVLRAEMPLIVVISNCPQQNNPAGRICAHARRCRRQPGGVKEKRYQRCFRTCAAGYSVASLLHWFREAASCVRSHISPGPYRSFRELSLAGSVDPVIWCPPTS